MKIFTNRWASALVFAMQFVVVVPMAAAAASTPSAKSSEQKIPAELERFKDRYEAVMAKKDLDALATMVAPGFLHNGRDKEGMINYFKTFTPFINSYKMEIVRHQRKGAFLFVDYKIHTDMMTTEHSLPFKTINGELHFYGNQRPLNPDGSIGAAPKKL